LPAKLTTTVKNIEVKVANQDNRQIIREFYQYLQTIDTSENYQNGLLKVLIRYAEYIGENTTFYQIQEKEQILVFLDSKRKTDKDDPDKKWITTFLSMRITIAFGIRSLRKIKASLLLECLAPIPIFWVLSVF